MRENKVFCCANYVLAFQRFLEVTPADSLQRNLRLTLRSEFARRFGVLLGLASSFSFENMCLLGEVE